MATESLKRFGGEVEGNGYYSHVKEQMGDWISQDMLGDVRSTLNDTCLQSATKFAGYLLSSPLPVASTIFEGEHFALTLLFVPTATEAALRTYAPGTIVLYKPVHGKGELKGFNNQRVIQQDVMTPGEFGQVGTPVVTRLGGPRRTLSCSASQPAAILELVFSPRNREGGMTGEESVMNTGAGAGADANPPVTADDKDEVKRFTTIQPPASELATLFESSADSEGRTAELVARNALYAENAEKYDIFERIRYRVGGLSTELGEIVRRVLSSRQIAPQILKTLGLTHVRGILLHGPPGTGKTLIAREVARALNSRKPILINGPEIMDKYVGEAERNIRECFSAAEEEWAAKGPASELHVVIFDEFDSIAKRRGSLSGDGSGVRDSCVNQLLSKLDGVNEMNNILVIALTNRKDLIDPALLRPGRLEVHVEVKAPDGEGRQEILYILFKPLVLGGFVRLDDARVWCGRLAERTVGWTGADLSGMMRNAASFAIDRSLNGVPGGTVPSSPSSSPSSSITEVQILWEDINQAFKESSKGLEIPKRVWIGRYFRRKLKQFASVAGRRGGRGTGNGGDLKRQKRTFESILQATEDDFIDIENEGEENREGVGSELKASRVEWKDIGGTLMF